MSRSRSRSVTSIQQETNEEMLKRLELLMMPLVFHIRTLESALADMKTDMDKKFEYQPSQIVNFRARISNLEQQSRHTNHLLQLHKTLG